ncbi:hypothetical protein BGZ98_002898 [Dissophora globulifera]|nr:hypothetical protein BGZ98_002898 [Dissophora globulifera]
MNRNGNGNGLPFHFASAPPPRRPGLSSNPSSSSLSPGTRRLNPAKFFVLIGLCVISLLAFGKLFAPQEDNAILEPSTDQETSDEIERELIVQQIMETRKSAYAFEDFTEDGLLLPGNEHLLPATAILLGWKRIQGLKLIVSYLVRYPYIKQIIVWNNNKEIKLSRRDFEMDSSFGPLPELQVYNAAENLHDFAKYMSCSLAKYEHCYFQDDDWLNTHMDALYTNFLTCPSLLHTNTLPLIQMEHRRWTFTNEEYNMHAGFSWMGTGSYLPRKKAQRLLEQRGNTTLAKDRFKVIDMYFSLWTNQYPYQLVNYLTPLDQKNGWSTEGVSDHWSIVFRNMLDAADRLYSALLANTEVSDMDPFTREEEQPYVKDRHTRAPCFNDKCLFMTSLDPFPDPKEVVFKGDLQTIDEQNAKFMELDYPTTEFWRTFAYIHAVDNDPLTCWNSFKVPQAGDSFGLRFVKETALRHLTVTSSKSLTSLEGQITVLASDQHGIHWTTCQHTARYPFAHTMTLDINCPAVQMLPQGMLHQVKVQLDMDLEKSLEICGFGHATRVNQIITELLLSPSSSPSIAKSVEQPNWTAESINGTTETGPASVLDSTAAATTAITKTTIAQARHTIYIVSDAPQFIFQDVIALGAIYRNAKVDAGVVQPLAYSVDRQKTIEGVKTFLARRDEMIQHEVSWLADVGADMVLADAPFLPCAAADAYGIPACLITNFTFDEVYRFLREGDPLDKDVMACADAALEDYKKASLLLRLPGSIDIPSFGDEIMVLEGRQPVVKPLTFDEQKINIYDQKQIVNGTKDLSFRHNRKDPQLSVDTSSIVASRPSGLQRRAIDVPLVVRKAINTREDVLRSLGVDDITIRTKKMVLISFGGQRLKQGWGNPLPEGWIGVICGLPVSHELPEGFYRSPHGVYVPDLTHAADIVIGKLGYGTCSECIAHDTPLIYVSRPQFIEEHGLIKLMINHGLPVEMTAEEFETGLWQRSILEADRLAQEEREGRRLHLETFKEDESGGDVSTCISTRTTMTTTTANALERNRGNSGDHRRKKSVDAYSPSSSATLQIRTSKARSLAESVNMAEMARGGPISPQIDEDDPPLMSPARSRRSTSISSLTSATFPSKAMGASGAHDSMAATIAVSTAAAASKVVSAGIVVADGERDPSLLEQELHQPAAWFERRISHNGGKVCAQLVEEYMQMWLEHHSRARK